MNHPCAACGQPYHRYSTADPEHEWNPIACINSLRGRIDDLETNIEYLIATAKADNEKWTAALAAKAHQ